MSVSTGAFAVLHGYQSDLARVELLYTSLLVQATTEAHRVAVPRGSSTVSVRRSFLFGFSAKIGERFAEAHAAAARAADHADANSNANGDLRGDPAGVDRGASVAMVLADRNAQVDDYVRRRYGRLGTLGRDRVSHEGYGQGVAAGRRADLGTRRDVGAATRGAIGG